jgi:hypothetical protein
MTPSDIQSENLLWVVRIDPIAGPVSNLFRDYALTSGLKV